MGISPVSGGGYFPPVAPPPPTTGQPVATKSAKPADPDGDGDQDASGRLDVKA